MGDVYLNISKNMKKINKINLKKVKHISVHVMFTRFSNKVHMFNVDYCQSTVA